MLNWQVIQLMTARSPAWAVIAIDTGAFFNGCAHDCESAFYLVVQMRAMCGRDALKCCDSSCWYHEVLIWLKRENNLCFLFFSFSRHVNSSKGAWKFSKRRFFRRILFSKCKFLLLIWHVSILTASCLLGLLSKPLIYTFLFFFAALPTDEGPPLPCMKLRVTVCCEPSEYTPLFICSSFHASPLYTKRLFSLHFYYQGSVAWCLDCYLSPQLCLLLPPLFSSDPPLLSAKLNASLLLFKTA